MDDNSLLYIINILIQKSLKIVSLYNNLNFHAASILGNEISIIIIGAKDKQELSYLILKFYHNLYYYHKYEDPKILSYLDNIDYRDPVTELGILADVCSKEFETKMEKDFSKFLKKQYKELLSYQDPKFKKFVYGYLTNHPNTKFKLNTNSVKEFDLEKLTSFELFKLIQNESNLLKIYFAYLHLGYLDCLDNDNSDKPENISLMVEDIDKIMKFLNQKHKGDFSFIHKPFGFCFEDFDLILIDQPLKTEEMVLEIINNNSDISPFEVVEKLKKKKLNISSNIDEVVESYINKHPDGFDQKFYQPDLSKNKNQFLYQFLYQSDLYNNHKKAILRFISNDIIILPTQEKILLIQVPEKLSDSFIKALNLLPHKYIQYPHRPLFPKNYLIDDLANKLSNQLKNQLEEESRLEAERSLKEVEEYRSSLLKEIKDGPRLSPYRWSDYRRSDPDYLKSLKKVKKFLSLEVEQLKCLDDERSLNMMEQYRSSLLKKSKDGPKVSTGGLLSLLSYVGDPDELEYQQVKKKGLERLERFQEKIADRIAELRKEEERQQAEKSVRSKIHLHMMAALNRIKDLEQLQDELNN